MAQKVIVDCDMGTDDAVALCMLLFDSRFEIVGLTATEGCVTAEQANNNLQAILGELDPDRYPRLGMARGAENAPPVDTRYLYGDDGLGNAGLAVANLQHGQAAEKLIIDCVRAWPDQVTLLCLGPLTNIARAFQRDPAIAQMVDRIIMTGGTLSGIGNITPAAEFNFYFDPQSARQVVQSRTTKTLVPLDVTRQVEFGFEMLEGLPGDHTRTGYFLRHILPFAFRSYRQQLGHESINLNDAVGALALLAPELFQFQEMAGDVETEGELTRGVCVFDRRDPPEWRPNMEVATSIDAERARSLIVELLGHSGKLTSP